MQAQRRLAAFPDIDLIALDMYAEGFRSCEAAEISGWFVTSHEPTRLMVDAALLHLWTRFPPGMLQMGTS